MAGRLLHIVPKTVLNFSAMSVGTRPVVLAERINVSQYSNVVVVLHVHEFTTSALNSVVFDLRGDGFSTEEPGVIFFTPTPLHTQTVSTSGSSVLYTFGGFCGCEYVALVATGTRIGGGTISGTFSIDLVLRSPDER